MEESSVSGLGSSIQLSISVLGVRQEEECRRFSSTGPADARQQSLYITTGSPNLLGEVSHSRRWDAASSSFHFRRPACPVWGGRGGDVGMGLLQCLQL